MAIKIYDVIRGPVLTEKASKLVNQRKKVVLKVHPHANKKLVAEAIYKIFDVEVKSVNILNRPGKKRRSGKKTFVGSSQKRAIITLKDDESFDKLTKTGAGSVAGESSTAMGASGQSE